MTEQQENPVPFLSGQDESLKNSSDVQETPMTHHVVHKFCACSMTKRPQKSDVVKEIRGQSREAQGQESPPSLGSVRARVKLMET